MRTLALAGVFGFLSLTAGPAGSRQAAGGSCSSVSLRAEMAAAARAACGPVGASVQVVKGGGVVSVGGGRHLPMQSVYKLPIAMAVLHRVDVGRLRLDRKVTLNPGEMIPRPGYSPLRDAHPRGAVMTVSKLLDAMLTVSDNTASDSLLKLAGGPARVTAYLESLGIHDMDVETSEREMARSEQVQYRNWATPDAAVALLRTLSQGQALSKSSRDLLLGLMTASKTGPHQIRGLLPVGTTVAHKTGSSGTVRGLTRATNDIGLVTLPDGQHLAVAVFVSDSRADTATRDAVIAKIARAAWDCQVRPPASRRHFYQSNTFNTRTKETHP